MFSENIDCMLRACYLCLVHGLISPIIPQPVCTSLLGLLIRWWIIFPWGRVPLWSWVTGTQRFDWDDPRVCSSKRCVCGGQGGRHLRICHHFPCSRTSLRSQSVCSCTRESSLSAWYRGIRTRIRSRCPWSYRLHLRAPTVRSLLQEAWSCPTKRCVRYTARETTTLYGLTWMIKFLIVCWYSVSYTHLTLPTKRIV